MRDGVSGRGLVSTEWISYPQLCLRGTGGEGDSGGVAHRDRLRPFPLLLIDQQAHWRLFWATALMIYTSRLLPCQLRFNMAEPWASPAYSSGLTLVLRAVFSRQRLSANDLWHGCPAQHYYFLIISFRALHLISICRGQGCCGFAGRAGPHWVTHWISFQWQDSTVGFPRLLWLWDFMSSAPKLDSETRNLGAAAASEAKGCWQWAESSVVPACSLWGLGTAWGCLAWWV